jgi:hypothetical protein
VAGGQQSTMAGGEVEYLTLSSSTLGPNNQREAFQEPTRGRPMDRRHTLFALHRHNNIRGGRGAGGGGRGAGGWTLSLLSRAGKGGGWKEDKDDDNDDDDDDDDTMMAGGEVGRWAWVCGRERGH